MGLDKQVHRVIHKIVKEWVTERCYFCFSSENVIIQPISCGDEFSEALIIPGNLILVSEDMDVCGCIDQHNPVTSVISDNEPLPGCCKQHPTQCHSAKKISFSARILSRGQ